MKYLIITWSFVAIMVTACVSAELSGRVTDMQGQPLPYANVFLQNRAEGTMTDDDGWFRFTVSATGQFLLVCRYIGYHPYEKTITVTGKPIKLMIRLKPQPVEGQTVHVTASAFTTADEEGVTLTSLDVVRTPGAAADLFWAIKTFPGLQQVDEGAGLFVRGGNVTETTIILDGAMIQHPYKYESPTGGFFGTINPFLLKGTFFSSGGFSVQYGNALSGALVMESQDMPEQRMSGIGVGLAAASGYMAIPIVPGKFGIAASGNRSNTRLLFELNNSRRTFSDYPFSYDFNVGMYYHPGRQTRVKVMLFRQVDRVGVEVDDPDFNSFYVGNSVHQFANVRLSTVLSEQMWLKTNVAVSEYKREMQLGVMDLDMKDQVVQSRTTLESRVIGAATVRTGMVFMHNKTVIRGFVPEYNDDVDPHADRMVVATDYLWSNHAGFCELEWPLIGGMLITSGLRAQWNLQRHRVLLSPRFQADISLSTNSHITAAWGIYYQEPEPRYFDPNIGNPNLRQMKAVHTILGFVWQHEQRMVRIEAYHKEYSRLLLEDKAKNYSNQGHGYAWGVDCFVKQSMGPVSGRVAYSFLKSRRYWMDAPKMAPPYFDVPHNLTWVMTMDLPGRFSFGTSYRFAIGKPYSPGPDAYHTARVPDYQKWDMSVSRIHSFTGTDMTILYLAVSNLAGRRNIFDYRYSSDYKRRDPVESAFGRSIYFGVQVNFQ